MSTGSEWGLLGAIRIDLKRLHETWMELAFPRQRDAEHSVLGKWKPRTRSGKVAYRTWSGLGKPTIALLYPFVLLGFATRFYAARLDRTAASIGLIGVALLSVVGWGALSAAAYLSRISFEGFLAVVAAGGVATLSAVLAVLLSRVGGRFTTVVFAYPFGVTALFLPPVVAALYSPTVADVVFPRSQLLAVWLLDNVLDVYGLDRLLRASFELRGSAYVGMWFGLAVPVGWFLGIVVTLANVARPSG